MSESDVVKSIRKIIRDIEKEAEEYDSTEGKGRVDGGKLGMESAFRMLQQSIDTLPQRYQQACQAIFLVKMMVLAAKTRTAVEVIAGICHTDGCCIEDRVSEFSGELYRRSISSVVDSQKTASK